MVILNCYLEDDIIKKSTPLKLADWILTPYRKAFNGKNICLITNTSGMPQNIGEVSVGSSGLKRVLWGVLAVSIIPLAAIAVLFKAMFSPSIGSSTQPCWLCGRRTIENLEEVYESLEVLERTKLPGRVDFFLAQSPAHQNLNEKETSDSMILDLKERLGDSFNIMVFRGSTAAQPSLNKFALLSLYFTI
ncbi:MAG: hypothetical protein Tsb0021_07900 [Chlamydiales bacterium]